MTRHDLLRAAHTVACTLPAGFVLFGATVCLVVLRPFAAWRMLARTGWGPDGSGPGPTALRS